MTNGPDDILELGYMLDISHFLFTGQEPSLLDRPYGLRSNGRSYKMLVMFFFFFSPPNLRAPSADRRKTLPHDHNLCQFYKSTPKIRGALPPKKLGPKTCKISVDFIQPPTLIANISGTAQDIQNPKTNSSTAIPPALHEKVR